MNNLFVYLLELNIALMILFAAYKLFFERDGNFRVRRIYLLAVVILPVILPLLPDALRMPVGNIAPLSIQLEGVTIMGQGDAANASAHLSVNRLATLVYIVILGLGILKLFLQLARISMAAISSERIAVNGTTLLVNRSYHASSFFNLIFIDPDTLEGNSISHILEHENTHRREHHSIDRILTELFVMVNWFNPVAWLFRRAVIRNLEYLADSAVLRKGTDPHKYQLSILNQYIGSASISNQFSSQIKNRIIMLNKNYKLGSRWKIAMLIPFAAIAFFFVSCSEKDATAGAEDLKTEEPSGAESQVFYIVEEMPSFNGGEPKEFRKHIAQNLSYPTIAIDNGVTGKIFIKFIVTKEGKVEVPDQETLAKVEGKPLEEVVVYRTLEEDSETPDKKHIQLLKDEAIRVVSESPDWTPGKQSGKNVDVMFVFPITFALN
jgi:bla regulator protein blaR1